MSETFVRWDAPARLYAALAHLDLGRDAASLFDASRPRAPWVPALLQAYRAAPGRLLLHGIGLMRPHDLLVCLREDPPSGLRDEAGRALCRAAARAVDALAQTPIDYGLVPEDILEPLHRLRAGLWERHGGPPPLVVADCPALGWAGRAASADGQRVVAVALARPSAHVLCQIVHEDTHAVTDPVVRASWSAEGPARETAVGAAGYARHVALETAAVEVGEALFQARAPQWLHAYHQWRARF